MTGQIDQIDGSTIYSLGSPRLQAFADWLLKVIESGNLEVMFPAATREYAQFVEDLWNDSAIQATYNRRNELEMLSRAATYFLSRVRLSFVLSVLYFEQIMFVEILNILYLLSSMSMMGFNMNDKLSLLSILDFQIQICFV